MNLLALPSDIFLLVLEHLSSRDLIVVRRVSRAFYETFNDSDLNFSLLQQHFPRSREARNCKFYTTCTETAELFCRVARRYHQLGLGVPTSISTYVIAQSFVLPAWSRSYPVSPWQRELQFENKSAPFDYPDTLWTYDKGLLIFPSAELCTFAAVDLNNRTLSAIDIEADTRTTRRIRLEEGVLVVEWCEPEPYHQLNENETVYRHFATVYDLNWDKPSRQWKATFRFVFPCVLQRSIH
jgi:hypothetical protein